MLLDINLLDSIRFRILGEMYRGFGNKHHLRFNIVADIVNLQARY